jgi:PadR family transcriptional regulator PadR
VVSAAFAPWRNTSVGHRNKLANEEPNAAYYMGKYTSRSSTGEHAETTLPAAVRDGPGNAGHADPADACAGPAHGQTIAHAIERGSEDVLQVEHGSLYPALHRLQHRGWIAAFWGTSENNRKAKYYRLTPEGKRQLVAQTSRWEQVVRAIGRILNPVTERQG